MADISNKTLTIVIGIALVISLVGLFTLPNSPFSLAGLVVSQGQARLNITETASLNVTQALIDFGNGTLEQAFINCTLTSETPATPDPDDCWTGQGATSGGFEAVNIGNVKLNVTIAATKNGSNSTAFWGVLGGKYMWKCLGNGTTPTAVATYSNVNNTAIRCVDALNATSGQDGFSVHLNITIPPTALDVHNDTITFAASKA